MNSDSQSNLALLIIEAKTANFLAQNILEEISADHSDLSEELFTYWRNRAASWLEYSQVAAAMAENVSEKLQTREKRLSVHLN